MWLLSNRRINRGQKYATFFQNASKPRTPGSMMRQSYIGAPSLIRGAGCHHWTGGAGDRKKLENHEVKKSCILLSSMDGNWWKSCKMFLKKLEIVEKIGCEKKLQVVKKLVACIELVFERVSDRCRMGFSRAESNVTPFAVQLWHTIFSAYGVSFLQK